MYAIRFKSFMKNKKILITGGRGFIGSWLAQSLYRSNNVTLFDNGRRDATKFLSPQILKDVEQISGDIRDERIVKEVIKNKSIVIHLAAIAGVSSYERDPLGTLEVNLFGCATLLRTLVQSNVEKIILFSSSEVYGATAVNVKEEDTTCIGTLYEKRWSYAISKLAADHLALAFFHRYHLPISIIRPFNIYGPRQVGEGAVVNMIARIVQDGVIPVTGDGKQKRAWCYISDLVEAVRLLCQIKVVGECYNIGNPKQYVSVLQLAQYVQAIVPSSKIVFVKGPKTEIYTRMPNIDKAQRELGFDPVVTLQEGLRRTYDWYVRTIHDRGVL